MRARILCLTIILVLSSQLSSTPIVDATSLPHLNKGLTLRYEERGIWNSPVFYGEQWTRLGSITISILEVDEQNDVTRLRYSGAFTTMFPSVRTTTRIDVANLEESTLPQFTTYGYSGERLWFFNSTITLKGRIVTSIEGDRADVIVERGRPSGTDWSGHPSGEDWSQWSWTTDFPLNFPAKYFVSPTISPRDTVYSYEIYDTYEYRPKIRNSSYTVDQGETLPTAVGTFETLMSKSTSESETRSGVGMWRTDYKAYRDRATGIFLQSDTFGTLRRTDGKGQETYTYSSRLVEVKRIKSVLTLARFPIQRQLDLGSPLVVAGKITQPLGSIPITITVAANNGTKITQKVSTQRDGSFNVSLTPTFVGNWTLTVEYLGNLVVDPTGVRAGPCLVVARPSTVSQLYAYTPFIAVLVMAAIVVSFIFGLRRRRRNGRTPERPRPSSPAETEAQPAIQMPPKVEKPKFCVHCGAPIPRVAKHCSECGKTQV